VGDAIQWYLPVLNPGEKMNLSFQVTVLGGNKILNNSYAVRCDEGVYAYGEPVTTRVRYLNQNVVLPLVFRE
jgi:hypothetical protein